MRNGSEAAVEVTRRLAAYVVEARDEDIPGHVTHEAKRALLNWLGCAIGGSRHETVERALAAFAQFSGPAQASVLGRGERLDLLHAALLNGISSHVLDFDDTHHPTLIHPSGPVMAAALALCEREHGSGQAFLHAVILGIETSCRIGRAVFPSHYDAGWHITGTAGVFGAAAACGRLLGLNVQQMTWALGIAATQAAGLREMFGTMCKSLHPGRAAQNGLGAAFLARSGFTSSERALEASRGFAHVLASECDLSLVLDQLGERFELLSNTYKPFACGLVIHPVIDGCLRLRAQHDLKGPEIEAIHLSINPLVLELTGNKAPQRGLEGKFSVYHSAAVAVLHGAAGEAQYSDDVIRDPEVIALRQKVEVQSLAHIGNTAARVSIRLNDGRVLTEEVTRTIGSLEQPMSDTQLEEKTRALANGPLTPGATDRLIALCWSADLLEDSAILAQSSVPAP